MNLSNPICGFQVRSPYPAIAEHKNGLGPDADVIAL
jgi:hypothetical protein